MKIKLKSKSKTTVPTVERKTSIASKQKVDKVEPVKYDRQDPNRVLPYRYRKFFFNTGSAVNESKN